MYVGKNDWGDCVNNDIRACIDFPDERPSRSATDYGFETHKDFGCILFEKGEFKLAAK